MKDTRQPTYLRREGTEERVVGLKGFAFTHEEAEPPSRHETIDTAVESLDPLVTCLVLHATWLQPGWVHNLDEDIPSDLFMCILSFFLLKAICEKLKLFPSSIVEKSCAFVLEKRGQIIARAFEPKQAFWEVNSLLSYLHKQCHYLSRIDPTLITSGPHFPPYTQRGSLVFHWEN